MNKKMTLDQLQETHSEMCATAADLGMSVPEELTVDFDSAELGRTVVANLDALIRKFRAGLDEADGKNSPSEDKKEVVEDGEKEQTAPTTSPTKAKVTKTKVTPAKADTTKDTTTKAVPAKAKQAAGAETPPAETGEEKVAKKAAKKAPAKKAAAKKANGAAKKPRAGAFDENAKITWGAKPNPAREASGRFERIEAVRKASGKTVKTFLAGKGNPTTLKNCVAAKLCTVA